MPSLLDPFGLWKVGFRIAGWAGTQVQHALVPQRPPLALEAGSSQPVASLGEKMRMLQTRALEQSTGSSRNELFHRILDQIVPDEARILGALSDGSVSAHVNVRGWSRAGLLENAALVGRTANLALPDMTPTYVGHLLSLGLLEVGAEDSALKDEYQILMAESPVLKAIKAGARGPIPARIEKGVVRLSSLGLALWDATAGERP